jgi:hypothetical protein
MDLDEWARQGYPEIEIRKREARGVSYHPPLVDWRYFDANAKRLEREARRWLRAGKPRWYDRFVGFFRRRRGVTP